MARKKEADAKVENPEATVDSTEDKSEPIANETPEPIKAGTTADDSGIKPKPFENLYTEITTRTRNGANGYWRGGVQHGEEKHTFEASIFTDEQLQKIINDPNLVHELAGD